MDKTGKNQWKLSCKSLFQFNQDQNEWNQRQKNMFFGGGGKIS